MSSQTESNDLAAEWCKTEMMKLARLRRLFDGVKTTNHRWEVLNFVAAHDYGGTTVFVSDVYHSLEMPRASTIRLIESLVDSGYLRKIDDAIDKRRKRLKLTELSKSQFLEIANFAN